MRHLLFKKGTNEDVEMSDSSPLPYTNSGDDKDVVMEDLQS